MSDPVLLEAGIQMRAEACPDEPADRWDLLRTVWDEAFQSINQRLKPWVLSNRSASTSSRRRRAPPGSVPLVLSAPPVL